MSRPFLVQRMRPAHLDRILQIERACFRKDAYDRNLFAAYASRCGPLFLVVRRRGGEICGYILTCESGEDAELISVAVDRGARTQGAASAMMESTLRRLRRLGIRRFELMVRVTNWRAIRFYEKYQFKKIRIVRRYYEDGRDAWLMRRPLD